MDKLVFYLLTRLLGWPIMKVMIKTMPTKERPKRQIAESDYRMFRRDQKAKKEIRALVLLLFDKVKKWNTSGSSKIK